VAIIGEGLLSDFVYEDLSLQYQLVRQRDFESGVPEGAKLALVLNDAWDPSVHDRANEMFQRTGTPWLRGFVSFGEGVVGPLVRSGTPGCSQCADTRQLLAGSDRIEMWGLQQRLSVQSAISYDAWASRTGLLQLAHLFAAEARRVMERGKGQLDNKVLLINLQTLKSSIHFFLPDPLCSVCGQLPDDNEMTSRIILRSSPKTSANSYRCRPIEELESILASDYLDSRMGFLNGKMRDLLSPFADSSINLPLFTGDEACGGRTHSYAASELTAIMEGLERYCGMSPRGKRTIVHGSFRNVIDQALDPVQIGLHKKDQYESPNFPFKPFDPDRPIDWVWGYSFLQERSILVPELLAYYSSGCGHGFVYETSNGCALGGSLEEAIFYGIMEVVERDSFLMTWYAQLPIPRLDPYSANDLELNLMVERLQEVAGYDVHLFNSTMEHGISSVWALAKNRTQEGINLICAAGAHLDPVRAVKSALHEVAGMLLSFNDKFKENRERYERMLYDPFLVQQMEDHSMLYSLPQAEERLKFLLDDNRPMRTFEEEYKTKVRHADLTDDLKELLQAFRRLNLDVVVVDQTTPETKRNGLYCVKVLIPGMLPMTFGQHLIRLTGLERVLRIPMELGYAKEPLTPEQLNPHPHPFP